jgi:glucan endo-1,3-alpha-glucosidase
MLMLVLRVSICSCQWNHILMVGLTLAGTGGGGGGGSGATTTTASPTTTTSSTPSSNTYVSMTWTSAGCYVDGANRMLRGSSTSIPGMTVEMCTGLCFKKKFTMAAVEFGTECYCGSQLFTTNGAGVKATPTDCNMPCAGTLLLPSLLDS